MKGKRIEKKSLIKEIKNLTSNKILKNNNIIINIYEFNKSFYNIIFNCYNQY